MKMEELQILEPHWTGPHKFTSTKGAKHTDRKTLVHCNDIQLAPEPSSDPADMQSCHNRYKPHATMDPSNKQFWNHGGITKVQSIVHIIKKKLSEKIQNGENKKAKYKNSKITKLTKDLIKENMPIIEVPIKKAPIKNIKVPIKNLMRIAWAHSNHTHQEDIKDNHRSKNYQFLQHHWSNQQPQAFTCYTAQNKITPLLHTAILLALSSLSMSFYQNNKGQLPSMMHLRAQLLDPPIGLQHKHHFSPRFSTICSIICKQGLALVHLHSQATRDLHSILLLLDHAPAKVITLWPTSTALYTMTPELFSTHWTWFLYSTITPTPEVKLSHHHL